MLEHLLPFLIGAVVGWMTFYFIRKYEFLTGLTFSGMLDIV